MVSVIIPTYNREKLIKRSIESVLAQTYADLECIVVDDGSTDNTQSVVEAIPDHRVKYVKLPEGKGANAARNFGVSIAKGEYIAFQDSDDLWDPEKLERQLAFMKEHGYAFTFTDYRIRYPDGTESPYIYTGPKKVRKWQVYCYCYFSTITVLYDANVVGLIQIEDIKKNNDYAMWFQAAEKTPMYRFPESLSWYCKREVSISSGSKLKLIRHHYIMYRKALRKAVIPSLFYTGLNLVCGTLKKLIYRERVE